MNGHTIFGSETSGTNNYVRVSPAGGLYVNISDYALSGQVDILSGQVLQNTDDIAEVSASIPDVQILEAASTLKTSLNAYYSEPTYSGTEITNIDKWETSGKINKVFSKTITWLSGRPVGIETVDNITNVTLTKEISYDLSGNITNITENLT